MKKQKRTILLVKIKRPNKPMEIIEARKKAGWTNKAIRQFVKGIKIAYPEATITTSTISE